MKSKTIVYLILFFFFSGIFAIYLSSEEEEKKDRQGSIKGQLVDKDTMSPIAGAVVSVKGNNIKTLTDDKGNFLISNIKVGNYTLIFVYPGFVPFTKLDIIVKSNRITFIDARMELIPSVTEKITVTAGYFQQMESVPKSKVNFSFEEIRRAPGSAGDVSRVVFSLPGVSKVSDFFNSLIVRGGNPSENTFFVDNIEITNINHFPLQGSSGGPIGLLNLDFINDVDFFLGGFSPIFGDRLSSIMDIRFREGNRDEFDIQLDLNMGGFGMVMEGPITEKGSWMFSARKSYLDLLVDAIGTGVAPRFSDIQGKLVYDLSPKSKISFLGIIGFDKISFKRVDQIERGDPQYGDMGNTEYTFGMNWFQIWSDKGYSNTSFSTSYTKYDSTIYETATEDLFIDNISTEQSLSFRNVNHLTFDYNNKVEFGVEIKHLIAKFNYFLRGYIDYFGNVMPPIQKNVDIGATKFGVFLNYRLSSIKPFTLNLGLRADYFSHNQNFHLSPRFSITAKLSDKIYIYGSTGIFYQNLPLLLLYQREKNKELKDPKANHYTLGINYLFSDNMQLTIELYDKEYRNFPVDPMQGSLFISDSFQYEGMFFQHDDLLDTGGAFSRGIEFILKQKLKSKLYGMISGTIYKTQYKDYYGQWKDRLYDNRYSFSIQGGYKFSNGWEFSIRWIYAGGIPYTPYDIPASKAVNSGILDQSQIQAVRLAPYHSLNLRVDKRFYFRKSNLIVFLDIWNVYDQKNIGFIYWNTLKNEPDKLYSWGFLPVAGLEFEF